MEHVHTERTRRPSRGCVRGCAGCAGAVAIAIGLVAIATILVQADRDQARAEPVSTERLHPELPAVAAPPVVEAEHGVSEAAPDLPTPAPVRVVVDLTFGELEVEPSSDGGLEALVQHRPDRDEVDDTLEELPDGGVEYRIRVRNRSVWWRRILDREGSAPSLRLRLPADRPLELEVDLGAGETDFELGGLWLQGLDLELGAGEHRVSFSSPSFAPAESVAIRSAAGELDVAGLGNASPRFARVGIKAGQLDLDLAGSWRHDGSVDVSFAAGGCTVHLPGESANVVVEDVDVSLGDASVRRQTAAGPDAPTVTLSVTGAAGGLEIR